MIYLVEDDSSIREIVIYALTAQGFQARGFGRPEPFWEAMEQERPALVILDIMLPGEDGLHILSRLRGSAVTKRLPVILLTAKGTEYDKVVGLDAGADDYIAKPFGMMELLSRVKALLRRAEDTGEEEFRVGGLYLCPAKHIVKLDGRPLTLTLKEFELLCLFMEHPGVVFSRAQLLDKVWGYAFDGESRTVDVHIRTLRQKLGDSGALIETVRGMGYKMGDGLQ